MLKLTVAVLAFAIAGSASAAGWRKLQIDASSEAAFNQSVATFQKKLSPSRRVAFAMSLEDIWLAGSRLAEEQQREYTQADYLRQLDGLGYEEVVTLTDPTGKTAAGYRREYYYARASAGLGAGQSGNPQSGNPLWVYSGTVRYPRGQSDLTGPTGVPGLTP